MNPEKEKQYRESLQGLAEAIQNTYPSLDLSPVSLAEGEALMIHRLNEDKMLIRLYSHNSRTSDGGILKLGFICGLGRVTVRPLSAQNPEDAGSRLLHTAYAALLVNQSRAA